MCSTDLFLHSKEDLLLLTTIVIYILRELSLFSIILQTYLCLHNLSIVRCCLFSFVYGQQHLFMDNNILSGICFGS